MLQVPRRPAPGCVGLLTCPVCDDPLADAARSLRCPRGHSFDRARPGYVDLLPTGHGRSGIRGDSADMIAARSRFLARGHYDPLIRRVGDRLIEDLVERVPAGRPAAVLEVGCGDGTYLEAVARAAAGRRPEGDLCLFGLDVSRPAVRAAARRVPGATVFLNDVRHRICMADASVDVLLDVFSPRNPTELGRVARPGGLLLVVIPTARHLAELRDHVPILAVGAEKRTRTLEALGRAFTLEAAEDLALPLELAGQEVSDLVGMTPSAWHLDDDDRARLAALSSLPVTASVTILALRRVAEADRP